MRLINPITPGEYRYPTITPFTIPDGHTYLKTLEHLVECMKTLIDSVNENNEEMQTFVVELINTKIDEINTAFQQQQQEVEDQLEQQNTNITTQLSNQNDAINTLISETETFVNDTVQQIINSSIEVQDPVVAGIFGDPESDSRDVTDALYATTASVATLTNRVDNITVNVLDYGAVGDGVADDTDAVQAALNTGRDVLIPSGYTFLVDGVALTENNQTISGGGTLKLADETWASVVTANALTGVHVFVNIDGNASGNPLDNGEFTYLGQPVSAQDRGAVRLQNCKNSVITSRIVNAHSSPAVLVKCVESFIENSFSKGHHREGFGIESGYACGIVDNVSVWGGDTPHVPWSLVYTSYSESPDDSDHSHVVKGNYCEDSQAAHITVNTLNTLVADNHVVKTRGMEVSGPGIRIGHNLPGSSGDGCIVSNNIVEGIISTTPFGGAAGNRGITIDRGKNVIVEGNVVRNCHTGIGVSVTVDNSARIYRNDIQPIERGITVTGAEATFLIIDNTITGGNIGIRFNALGAGSRVSSNLVRDTLQVGIETVFGAGADMTDFELFDNGVFTETGEKYSLVGTVGYSLLHGNIGYQSELPKAHLYGSEAPTAGYHLRGMMMWNTLPTNGSPVGWVCISTGTPGTWVPMATL